MGARFYVRMLAQTIVWLAFMALWLFLPAGNWHWAQGWAFVAIFGFGSLAFIVWLAPRDPALLESRMNVGAQEGQPWWDRLFLMVFIGFWFFWFAFMSADAERFHWAPPLPVWLNALGGAMIVAGFGATAFVFTANSFAAPVIRIQEERKQHVIDTGPYAYVRHPMYACAILYLTGLPLLLGSLWGLIGTLAFIVGVTFRSMGEEQTLKRELEGYDDYMRRVRYRLIPGVI